MTASTLAILLGVTYTLFQTALSGYLITKSVRLKPSTIATTSGISLAAGPSVTILGDKWNIDVKTQQGSDMHLSLGSEWGFHPEYPSTISFTIDGNTSLASFNDDGDILFVFSVNDQHFSEIVSIDSRRSAYKQCPISHRPLIARDVTEMITFTQPQRYYRFCENAVNTPNAEVLDHWINHSPQYKTPGQWPMLLSITNNPVLNTTSYSWTDDAATNPSKVSSQYITSFASNQGFNMFISGDNLNEDFFIFAIDVTYQYTMPPTPLPTAFPTVPTSNPSRHPTIPPTTAIPSTNPTKSPSNIPTVSPTRVPSSSPTRIPTTNPTRNPTSNPTTRIPTIHPTPIPTLNPTVQPTPPPTNPTRNPTANPSIPPTKGPTVEPTTAQPSIHPTLYPSIPPTITPTNIPTIPPTLLPSIPPTMSPTPAPTTYPTPAPTTDPTAAPSMNPSAAPSMTPTPAPTMTPTRAPTFIPTPLPTDAPIIPGSPTVFPTVPTPMPTEGPTLTPTPNPTISPTANPTRNPTVSPTKQPTSHPSNTPTSVPSSMPTVPPSNNPTFNPSDMPTMFDTMEPTHRPTPDPTTQPTRTPSAKPTDLPTKRPTNIPTKVDVGSTDIAIIVGRDTSEAMREESEMTMPVVVIIFMGSAALCVVIMVSLRNLCKPEEMDHKMSKQRSENPEGSDTDMVPSQHRHEVYTVHLNAGALSDTDSVDAVNTKHICHVHPRPGTKGKKLSLSDRMNRSRFAVFRRNTESGKHDTSTDSMINEGDNSQSSIHTVSESTDDKMVPLDERDNMAKFIQLVADKRKMYILSGDDADENSTSSF